LFTIYDDVFSSPYVVVTCCNDITGVFTASGMNVLYITCCFVHVDSSCFSSLQTRDM